MKQLNFKTPLAWSATVVAVSIMVYMCRSWRYQIMWQRCLDSDMADAEAFSYCYNFSHMDDVLWVLLWVLSLRLLYLLGKNMCYIKNWICNWLYYYFIKKREDEEELYRELFKLFSKDKTLTEKQANIMHDIILNGGGSYLFHIYMGTPQEHRAYYEVSKGLPPLNEAYQRLKDIAYNLTIEQIRKEKQFRELKELFENDRFIYSNITRRQKIRMSDIIYYGGHKYVFGKFYEDMKEAVIYQKISDKNLPTNEMYQEIKDTVQSLCK